MRDPVLATVALALVCPSTLEAEEFDAGSLIIPMDLDYQDGSHLELEVEYAARIEVARQTPWGCRFLTILNGEEANSGRDSVRMGIRPGVWREIGPRVRHKSDTASRAPCSSASVGSP